MVTTFSDIHSDIIQSHILPKLDGPSLSATAAVSSDLKSLCSDDRLWADISNSTWPSITHPTLKQLISTFPAGHHSFFQDSFRGLGSSTHQHEYASTSTKLISAIDIRYKNNVVYSTHVFTDTTSHHFLSSAGRIELNDRPTGSKHEPINTRFIHLNVDEQATLSHLKESLTLSWILIDPTRKRAGNLSSIKPVSARKDWTTNATVLKYVTVLPGSDPGEMVQCKIEMVLLLGDSTRQSGLHVTLKLEDSNCKRLNGWEFLAFTRGILSEHNNVPRKVMNEEDRLKSRMKFKKMKSERMESERMVEERRRFSTKMNYIAILVSFCFSSFLFIFIPRYYNEEK